MPFENETQHPSFGTVQISRVSGNCRLFMSPHKHNNYVVLRINGARLGRDLSREWVFSNSRDEIVEVAMSEAQFAHMVTSLNMGSGTPCTIQRRRTGTLEQMPVAPESVGHREMFAHEIKETASKAIGRTRDAMRTVTAMLKAGKSGKTELKALEMELRLAVQDAEANMPFVCKQFERAMDSNIESAKAEIEAHALNTLSGIAYDAVARSLDPGTRDRFLGQIEDATKETTIDHREGSPEIERP